MKKVGENLKLKSEHSGENPKLKSQHSGDDKQHDSEGSDGEKYLSGEDAQSAGGSSSEEDDHEIFLSENHYQQVQKTNILGSVSYVKWMRKYNYLFGIDMQRGRMLLYKKTKQTKPSTYYKLMKGKFDNNEKEDGDEVIRIRNKKGRKFMLKLDSNKDPKKVKEYLLLCFQLQVECKKHQMGEWRQALTTTNSAPSKGFYATLGRSVMQVYNQPFNVSSGIIVDMKRSGEQDAVKMKKSKKEKERLNKIRGFQALSSLFFTQSDLLKEILSSISGFILNPFNSKALSESFAGGQRGLLIPFITNHCASPPHRSLRDWTRVQADIWHDRLDREEF